MQHTLDYLVRLNRSLLLLSKIENGQFPEAETVDLGAIVQRILGDLSEIYAARGIRAEQHGQESFTVQMNPSLAASLVSNLLKNAFVHNRPGGRVACRLYI